MAQVTLLAVLASVDLLLATIAACLRLAAEAIDGIAPAYVVGAKPPLLSPSPPA